MEQIRRATIITVVGARPNFMKAAPILRAIRDHNERHLSPTQLLLENVLVHTGQHYDQAMSDRFFADLNIPKPDVNLEVGSGSHAIQTAEIMKRFEEVLLRVRPDALVIVGDVNSTVACALVAAKISYDADGTKPLIAHVEAGLRSFDRTMPEEINRIVTDHLADLLFVTEESGLKNLRDEGIPEDRIFLVGNTMIDSLLAFRSKASHSTILGNLNLRASDTACGSTDGVIRYGLLTLHRPSNVDEPDTFLNILEGLRELADSCPVIFPIHPRARQRLSDFGLENLVRSENVWSVNPEARCQQRGIRVVDPLGYLDFLCLMDNASIVITDSGGIQEETTCLGIPCVTVRNNTERPVTIDVGTNVLAGTSKDGIRLAIREQLESKRKGTAPHKWDGRSAQRIIDTMHSALAEKKFGPITSVSTEEPKHAEIRD